MIGHRGEVEEKAFQVSFAEGKTGREGELSFLHIEFELPVRYPGTNEYFIAEHPGLELRHQVRLET